MSDGNRGLAASRRPFYPQQVVRTQQVVRPHREPVQAFRYNVVYRHSHSQTVSVSQPQSPATSPVHFNQTSSWTWPGDLRQHMRLHGLNASSSDTWSRQQLQAAHDTIHTRSGRGTPDSRDVIRFLR